MSKIVEQHIPCPSCPSSDAYCVYEDGHGYCFACQFYKPKDNLISDDLFTFEYLPFRGINKETFRKYNALTKVDKDGKPIAISYPHPDGLSAKVRTLPKEFKYVGDVSKAGCFGTNVFAAGSHKYLTITEGYEDALSLYQVLGSPCISVKSSGSALSDCTKDRNYINSFDRIYLAFDADGPGREAVKAVSKLFDYNKIYDVRFGGGDRKDANDYLTAGEQSELRNLWWNSKKFLPDNISSSLDDFEKELLVPPKRGIPWPFPTLTYMTGGLRTKEVVLICAMEGVGKTEVMHTLEHCLLKGTNDAIGAIYLEESKQRHLQALAGIELQAPVHLPDSGYSTGEVFAALKRVVPTDDRLFVYSHFGSDDPESLLDTIRFLVVSRGCRWILFDLISLAVAGLGGDREREALEYLSARLEMMTQELDFGLIMVSHINDNGFTRGSRMISKNCHIRVNLARDVLSPDDRVRLTTNVAVEKNRPAFRTGPAGRLLFNEMTATLKEDLDVAA